MTKDDLITKAQLFDLLSEKFADIEQQEMEYKGINIYGVKVLGEYPDEVRDYDDPEFKRDVECIFHRVLYLQKEDVIDLLRGKTISIYDNKGIEVLRIGVEDE